LKLNGIRFQGKIEIHWRAVHGADLQIVLDFIESGSRLG
jgi:hypothetical protein